MAVDGASIEGEGEENHSDNWQRDRNYGYVQSLVVKQGDSARKSHRCHQYRQETKNADQASSEENQSGERH
jgi:hypothetical protein